jgi:hypothetical protein
VGQQEFLGNALQLKSDIDICGLWEIAVSPHPRRSASRIQSASGVPGRTPDRNGKGKPGWSLMLHVTENGQSRARRAEE